MARLVKAWIQLVLEGRSGTRMASSGPHSNDPERRVSGESTPIQADHLPEHHVQALDRYNERTGTIPPRKKRNST